MAATATPLSMVVAPEEVAATGGSDVGWMSKVGVTEFDAESTGHHAEASISLVPLDDDVKGGVPLVEVGGAAILLGPWQQQAIEATLQLSDAGARLTLTAGVTLRIGPPAFNRVDPNSLEIVEGDPAIETFLGEPSITLEVGFDDAGLPTFDVSLDFDDAGPSIDDPFMIGETGVILDPGDVSLNLSGADGQQPSNAPDDWTGVYISDARLYVPELLDDSYVEVSDFGVGTGGVYGEVGYDADDALSYDDSDGSFSGGIAATEIGGMDAGVSRIDLTFVENVPQQASAEGKIRVPFFDQPVDVDVTIGVDGSFAVTFAAEDGLYTLDKEFLEFELRSLGFEAGDVPALTLGGKLAPKVSELPGDLDLPPVEVDAVTVDAEGNVDIEGGWLDLPDGYSAEIGVFAFEISKFGMGRTDAGGKWIGFNGGIKLLEGIPAGASAEGLRIVWDEPGSTGPEVTLDGVGVEFKVPGTLGFKGEVAFGDDEFRGEIDLELIALDMTIDAELVFGTAQGPDGQFRYMGVYIDADLPAGIPLWATGLSLYGFGGLFANGMSPDKGDDQKWYSVEGRADPSASWFHQEEKGVTDIINKWAPEQGAMGFGASVAVATTPDNGLSVASDVTLVIVFPGPIIMLQGRAELLQEGASIDGDAPYQALAVLDNRAGTFTLGVDANYVKPEGDGTLVDIGASAEAFYSFSDPDAWYLNVGKKEPKDQRVRAKALLLFSADAYLMLDPTRLAFGVWVGYDESWSFGPLGVSLSAWVSSDVLISFAPTHFYGNLNLHGEVSIRAFGVSAGITVDAFVEADVLDPLHILGDFSVSLSTPWPLPDPSASVTLEWGPTPDPPALPDPVGDVGVGHKKLGSTWDPAESEAGANGGSENSDRPVVPLDARPTVTFDRPVHNDSDVAGNDHPPDPPEELIGDPVENEGPATATYVLDEVELRKWDDDAGKWDPDAVGDLHGTWAPMPRQPKQGGSGDAGGADLTQTKLQLGTRTPYAYGRNAGGAWETAIERWYPDYPCPPEFHCYDFEGLNLNADFDVSHEGVPSPYYSYRRTTHEDDPWLRFSVDDEGWPDAGSVPLTINPLVTGERALVFRESGEQRRARRRGDVDESELYAHRLYLFLPTPLRSVKLRIRSMKYPTKGRVTTATSPSTEYADNWSMSQGEEREIVLTADGDDGLWLLELEFNGSLAVVEACQADVDLATTPGRDLRRGIEERRDRLSAWEDAGPVLEPYSTYQLKVVTETSGEGRQGFDWSETETRERYVEFETEGPPGISTPSELAGGGPEGERRTVLDTLSRYVDQTTPPTVPAEGEPPPLPRPVYRADPVGVDFNEDYVDLMYRLADRDLAVYLFDANDEPARDARGRLVVAENQWGETEDLLLDRAERRWFATVGASHCLDLDGLDLVRTKRLEHAAEERVLAPDAVHEARLTPLLFRDGFEDAEDRWEDVDEPGSGGGSSWTTEGHGGFVGTDAEKVGAKTIEFTDSSPESDLLARTDTITFRGQSGDDGDGGDSYGIVDTDPAAGTVTLGADPGDLTGVEYEIPARYVARQTNAVGGPSRDAPGTIWKLESARSGAPSPGSWPDVRAAVTLRTRQGATGVVGVVFRYRDGAHYRFTMNNERGYRRLARVVDGSVEASWEVDKSYRSGIDYRVAVEAIGDEIRVLVDGEPAFAVTDPEGPNEGTIGLYSRANGGAQFGDVRVDDYRDGAPVAYRFSFTTSLFADARHQLHSFQDETWTDAYPTDELPPTADLPPADREAEYRQYERAAAEITGGLAYPDRLEVTRLDDPADGTTKGLLVRSPEPIDASETDLAVERGPRFAATPQPPGRLKLTGAALGADPSVSLLWRETGDVSGYAVEYRRSTTPGFAPTLAGRRIGDDFADPESLDRYAVVDGPGEAWSVADGTLAASGPGRKAVVHEGSGGAEGVLTASVTPGESAAAGVAFRHRNPGDEYRFVLDTGDGRRLVRVSGGSRTVLWEDPDPDSVRAGRTYKVLIDVGDGTIRGSLDGVPLFAVPDPTPSTAGRVGLFADDDATFGSLSVHGEAIESPLFDRSFEDPEAGDWRVVDEPPRSTRSSDWQFDAGAGELRQTSNLYGFYGPPINAPGTLAVAGDQEWTDYRLSTRLTSDDDDAIGVVFRYRDEDNFYRFSMDSQREYRRLIRKIDGEPRLLWDDDAGFEPGRTYQVTVDCVGDRLTGYLDGRELFSVRDDRLERGAVGLYCRANVGARFHEVRVTAPGDAWLPYHTFGDEKPLPAGTRVELSPNAPNDAGGARFEHRRPNGIGTDRLPPGGAQFRVRTPAGDPGHVRGFQPDYEPVSGLSAVWSRDGAGVLLFNDGLEAGRYRLTFSPAAGADDPTLDGPVSIDVPWEPPK